MASFSSSAWKNSVLGIFLVGVLGVTGYFLSGTDVEIPFVSNSYTVSFHSDDVDNLVPAAQVRVAGVRVGRVRSVESEGGQARVEMSLDSVAAPLHEGVKIRVGARSVVGESYVEVKDGTGEALSSGTKLPASAVQPSVQVHDVLRSLDPEARKALGSIVRTLGKSTKGTRGDVSRIMSGLGGLGREGATAVDAIAAQSQDLKVLARHTSRVLAALNTGEGQIGTLVEEAQRVTSATSRQNEHIKQSMRELPAVLSSAATASGKLGELSGALQPVTADLKKAAPHLTKALNQLPATTADLRGLLPSLDSVLTKSPGTLSRLPEFSQDVRALVPRLRTTMSHLNPMLGYLEPYGPELAAFFTNFNAILGYTDEAGIHFIRMLPAFGHLQGTTGEPMKFPEVLDYKNPYPWPGQATDPGPNGRPFTKLHPQPK